MNRTGRIDDCRYRTVLDQEQPDQETSYCDRYECTLRNGCPSYRDLYIAEPEIQDESEQVEAGGLLTEAELLRMYEGVNTVDVRR